MEDMAEPYVRGKESSAGSLVASYGAYSVLPIELFDSFAVAYLTVCLIAPKEHL